MLGSELKVSVVPLPLIWWLFASYMVPNNYWATPTKVEFCWAATITFFWKHFQIYKHICLYGVGLIYFTQKIKFLF